MKTDYISSTMALLNALGQLETQDLQRAALRSQMQQSERAAELEAENANNLFAPGNLRNVSDFLQTLYPYGMGMDDSFKSQLLQRIDGMPQMSAQASQPQIPPELAEIFNKLNQQPQ